MLKLNYHQDSCRCIEFSDDGNILYTGSKDNSLAVVSNGKVEGKIAKAHPEAINSILHLEGGHTIATGDDDGMIKLWDLR